MFWGITELVILGRQGGRVFLALVQWSLHTSTFMGKLKNVLEKL
jgi:hypothetical protein